jgi:methylated-DNA-protein-cysteine methyltransferase related protein
MTERRTAQRPRQVGICLKHLPAAGSTTDDTATRYHNENVPWQRVINAKGIISPR